MKTIQLHHATIEDRDSGLDVQCYEFKMKAKHKDNTDMLQHFIDDRYCGKMKKVVFIAMVGSETNDYFITDNYNKVIDFFRYSLPNEVYFLFEEPTYEEAFEYCKSHCEVHELGLN
jgi:hypothetical protein